MLSAGLTNPSITDGFRLQRIGNMELDSFYIFILEEMLNKLPSCRGDVRHFYAPYDVKLCYDDGQNYGNAV